MDGIVLHDRYRLEKRIGVGGMAYVYEAEDTLLNRKVAVKILKEQFVEDDDFLRKFDNEAKAAALLSHPNIVSVYDVGNEEVNGKDLHYIVMELVEGTTLAEVIASQGVMTNKAIVRIARQIAKALECAHDHGIVHRDVKPANILIMKSGDVKVADFGIARISSAATITYTNTILGTVHYISPEQAKGHFIDKRSDIYSLGVVLYEMATGEVPFDAENAVGIAIKHIQERPIPPINHNPRLAPGLNSIIMKCLEKEPDNRYYNASELIHDLNHYEELPAAKAGASQKEETVKMERVAAASPEAVYRSRPERPADEEEEEKKTSPSFKWILLLLILAVTAVVLTVTYFGRHNDAILQASQTKVPAVTQLTEEKALETLKEHELSGNVINRVNDPEAEAGIVIQQSIKSGTTVEKGARVDLVVSLGKTKIAVPDVRGKTPEEAALLLENAGLKRGINTFSDDDTIEKDRVIGSDPSIGKEIEPGSRVNLIVSSGKRETTVVVPALLGQNQSDAMTRISDSQLRLGRIKTEYSDYAAGIVIEQSIRPGERVEKMTTIDITVSKGEEPAKSSSQAKPQTILYNIRFYPPAGKESFEVTVFDYNSSKDKPIFKKTFKAADAGDKGYILQSVEAAEDADLKIFYDGQPADTKPTPSSEEGEGSSQ